MEKLKSRVELLQNDIENIILGCDLLLQNKKWNRGQMQQVFEFKHAATVFNSRINDFLGKSLANKSKADGKEILLRACN